MYEIKGQFNTARVYADTLEDSATVQIQAFLDSIHADALATGATEKPSIAIMPDCHAGKGCVIGFTEKFHSDHVVPSLVGCDIGCGMLAFKLHGIEFDQRGLRSLDNACHRAIKSGFDIWSSAQKHRFATNFAAQLRKIKAPVNLEKAECSIGSLGGGNHFVELNQASDGDHWLVVHTGSRHLGLEVEAYYTDKATIVDKDLRAVVGEDYKDYINDMGITQKFAKVNRLAIMWNLLEAMGATRERAPEFLVDSIETVHNYIDLETRTIRKGAISLKAGERAIIPMNMADGSLLVTGKGNPAWNCSGPHGAGRLMSRGAARRELTMEAFRASMEGVYSTTVNEDTIDESKMAYKPMETIVAAIGETCTIDETIKPVYNFKAAEKRRRR